MADRWLVAFFTNGGSPATGLSPTVTVRRLSDNSPVLTAQSLSQVGDGWYKYLWSAYDVNEHYVVVYDAGTDSVDARYLYSESSVAEVRPTYEEVLALSTTVDSVKPHNLSYEYIKATVPNLVRKVAVGILDHIIIKTKADADPDWSTPLSTEIVYMWYENLGDRNPQYVKENNP